VLNAIIRFSLGHRSLIVAICLVLTVYGGYLSTTLPIDVFPDLDRPRVVILAECPGLSPEEVEILVTQPIETAILGASGVEAVRSQSSPALAVIYVEFGWRTEIRAARQVVTERLGTVPMPPGIRPQMTPPASIMGQFMHFGLSWKSDAPSRQGKTALLNQIELRTLADWVIRPRLLKLPGIAEVIVMGGDKKQYQILIDPDKLQEFNVSLQEIESAIRSNNLNTSGGFVEEGQTERPVRVIGRLGPLPAQVIDDLRKVAVKSTGDRPILLENVARIEEGPAPKRGDASVNGNAGIVVTVVKQPHSDTRALTDEVKAALGDLHGSLPDGVVINTQLFQLRSFIDRGIYYVEEALAIGAVLVVIVLFLFLLNLRTTFITLTAIPLSLVITTLVFRLVGFLTGTELSINVMTLGGIAVAMGELVDDAIVDVENIFRRLRENNAASVPKPALLVVYDASREIRSAVVFGTAVVILAFVPLFALTGIEGRLFVPLGIAYILSILASLVVSLTLTPVLSYYLLPQSSATHRTSDGLLLRLLKWGASGLIRFSMRYAGLLLLLTWVLVAVSAWQLLQLGTDFLPKFDEGSVQINVTLPGGSSLRASGEVAAMIDAKLKTMQVTPDQPTAPIAHFAVRLGRAELDEHAEPVSRGEYILTMNPSAHYRRDEFLKNLLAELRAEVPGVEIEAEQPLSHLISHMLSGVNAQIAIKVFGDDLDKLQQLARRIRDAVASVPGVTSPIVDPEERVDELQIVLRPDDLAFFGLSREYVADFVQTALKGVAISQVLEGQRRFDLVVKLRDAHRSDAQRLGDLRLDLPNSRGQIRLSDIADFPETASGPNLINRDNVRRRQVVRCNVEGRDLGSAVAEIERRVRDSVALPEGYFVEFGGQFEAQRSATTLISVLAVVSFAGMFIVLMMLYPSTRIALQILNAVPTAFIGGVLALVITRQTLTVASLVGFVSLTGIAVRNGILLVTHYFHLMKEEGEAFTKHMVLRGSLERLAPVLMTALTAGIALVPIVVGGKKPGLEILYPVATVILGGLITATFCEFLIHPGLFWKFSGQDAERLVSNQSAETELLRAGE
jgi:HME family heavy-metal exporter